MTEPGQAGGRRPEGGKWRWIADLGRRAEKEPQRREARREKTGRKEKLLSKTDFLQRKAHQGVRGCPPAAAWAGRTAEGRKAPEGGALQPVGANHRDVTTPPGLGVRQPSGALAAGARRTAGEVWGWGAGPGRGRKAVEGYRTPRRSRAPRSAGERASVLECGSPLPLCYERDS